MVRWYGMGFSYQTTYQTTVPYQVLQYAGYMLQIVTEFCLLHLTASHAGCTYFVLSSKVHVENFSSQYMCVCVYGNSSWF